MSALELRNLSIKLALGLMKLGVTSSDDKIGIFIENRLENAIILFCSFFLGTTCVPINFSYTKSKNYIIGILFIVFCFVGFFLYFRIKSKKLAKLKILYFLGELDQALRITKPKILFTTKSVLDKVLSVAKENIFLKKIIVLDAVNLVKSPENLLISYNDLMKNVQANDFDNFKCPPQNLADHVSLILYSSGTTGLPKGVQITDDNIMVSLSDTK